MARLDSLDKQLLQLLQKNARQSSEALAGQLKVSAATVRRRVRRLLQDKVISIVAVADPVQIGLPLIVVVGLDVAHDRLDSVMQMLAGQAEVLWLATTTGRFDIVALARFASTDELYKFMQRELANMEGIRDSETLICLHLKKAPYMPT